MWRRVLIAVVGFLALGAWLVYTSDDADGAGGADRVERGAGSYVYAEPSVMRDRFRAGRYGNAAGKIMPGWVFEEAKDYVRAHPWVAPGGVSPRACADEVRARQACTARGGWDWSWLEWTKDRLNDHRCLSLGPSPFTWFGCDGVPDWIHTVRRVKVRCGGAMLIIALATRQPIAVGTGGAVCFWNEFNNHFYGSGAERAAVR